MFVLPLEEINHFLENQRKTVGLYICFTSFIILNLKLNFHLFCVPQKGTHIFFKYKFVLRIPNVEPDLEVFQKKVQKHNCRFSRSIYCVLFLKPNLHFVFVTPKTDINIVLLMETNSFTKKTSTTDKKIPIFFSFIIDF